MSTASLDSNSQSTLVIPPTTTPPLIGTINTIRKPSPKQRKLLSVSQTDPPHSSTGAMHNDDNDMSEDDTAAVTTEPTTGTTTHTTTNTTTNNTIKQTIWHHEIQHIHHPPIGDLLPASASALVPDPDPDPDRPLLPIVVSTVLLQDPEITATTATTPTTTGTGTLAAPMNAASALSSKSAAGAGKKTGEKIKKSKKTPQPAVDVECDYDLEDDFIDDSEMFVEAMEGVQEIPDWDYGYFVWHGSVENFYDQPKLKSKLVKKKDNPKESVASIIFMRKEIDADVQSKSTAALSAEKPTNITKPAKVASTPTSGGDAHAAVNSQPAKPVKPTITKSASTDQVKLKSSASKGGAGRASLGANTPTTTGGKGSKVTPTSSTPLSTSKPDAVSSTKSVTASTPKSSERQSNHDSDGLPPSVLDKIKHIRTVAASKTFQDKNQFPGSLVTPLRDCIWEAMEYQVHDTPLYTRLASILPYNVTILKKIAVKLIFPERLRIIKEQVRHMYTIMKENVEAAVALQQTAEANASLQPNPPSGSPPVDEDNTKPKFKWEDDARVYLWNILCLEWELADLDNITNTLNNEKPRFIESTVRRAVYGKMCSFWPPSWMDTNLLSREYSQLKKRVHRICSRTDAGEEIEIAGVKVRRDPFARSTYVRKSLTKVMVSQSPQGGSQQQSNAVPPPTTPCPPPTSTSSEKKSVIIAIPPTTAVREMDKVSTPAVATTPTPAASSTPLVASVKKSDSGSAQSHPLSDTTTVHTTNDKKRLWPEQHTTDGKKTKIRSDIIVLE
ncbi:hypothetical protein BASA60_004760 [Batrachochytrium salamandrivorans]|nr:hypothetical protein BASA60_004760 [Batrachochytrium salamandrivorans]